MAVAGADSASGEGEGWAGGRCDPPPPSLLPSLLPPLLPPLLLLRPRLLVDGSLLGVAVGGADAAAGAGPLTRVLPVWLCMLDRGV